MKIRKIIAAMTAICLVGGSIPTVYGTMLPSLFTAKAAETSGVCGENLTWTLDKDGTLTISGTGEMFDYSQIQSPFFDNDAIKSVIIPSTINSIGNDCFYDCSNLTTINIPDSLESIGIGAFLGCEALEEINIPDSVTNIGRRAFWRTAWLKKQQENDPLVIVNGILLDGTAVKDKEVVIPDGVTEISGMAFYENNIIESVIISDSVKKVEYWVFSDCTSLKNCKLSASLESINHAMFWGCSSLEEIELPNSIKEIGFRSFSGCSLLKEIIIPDSVESISPGAFAGCGFSEIVIPASVKTLTVLPGYDYYGEGGLGETPATFYGNKLMSVTFENPNTDFGDLDVDLDDAMWLRRIISNTMDTYYNYTGTVYGYANSTAQKYAELCGYNFVVLPEPEKNVSFGDPTGDEKTDANDASFVLVEYAKLSTGSESELTEAERSAADVNNDGKIDSKDASIILGYYSYLSTGGSLSLPEFIANEM